MPIIAPADNFLDAVALAFREFPGSCIPDSTDIGAHALELAANNWEVFPLAGKHPRIPNPHPEGSRERRECRGECGKWGHGVLDATTHPAIIAYWWNTYRGTNIGVRVPQNMFVLDIDPRHGGLESLVRLQTANGVLPATLMTFSGRGDGGHHYFYRRPLGRLSDARLGPGIDIKTSAGYVVIPPSIHPDSGRPYVRIDRPVVAPPDWLIELITPEPEPVATTSRPRSIFSSFWSDSIADAFCEASSWAEILEPHGWRCLDADPDADGAVWLHPTHTSSCSATIRFGCLFVYSTSTEFEVTEPSNPNGYTKFRAHALLNHGDDMSAAAQALREAG